MPEEEKSKDKKKEDKEKEIVEVEDTGSEKAWAMWVASQKQEQPKKPKLEVVLDEEKVEDLERDIKKVSGQKKKTSRNEYEPVVKYDEIKYDEVADEYEIMENPNNSPKDKKRKPGEALVSREDMIIEDSKKYDFRR